MNLQVRLRYKLALVGAVLLAVLVWVSGYRHGHQAGATSGPNASPILPKNDTEQITVDPGTHRITILTPSGPKTETLPDRPSTFDIHKDGTVTISSKQLGFETKPFIGIGLGEGVRVYAGADLGYFKRLDLGLGFASPRLSKGDLTDIRGLFKVSYNVYSNTSINLGYDTSKTVHVFLSVRL
jgi:hypothetical protein